MDNIVVSTKNLLEDLPAAGSSMEKNLVVAESLMEQNLVVAKSLMEKNLVAAESSNVAKKGPVLPSRIERHSEDIVLRRIMRIRIGRIFLCPPFQQNHFHIFFEVAWLH